EGGSMHIMDAGGGGPNQDDFVGKCPPGELAVQNIADGKMGKRFRWAKVVNEQLPSVVRGYKPLSHADAIHPVTPNLNGQLRLAQVVPGTDDGQRRKDILAALDGQWHPAHDTILIILQTEIARGCRGSGEHFKIALRRIGTQKWPNMCGLC